MTIEIQFENYVRGVRTHQQSAPVLAARLQKSAPDDITPTERKKLRALVEAAHEVQLVQSERDRLAPAKLRPVMLAHTNHWSAFYEALSALGRVAESLNPDGPAAAMLAATLFPDGVSFTQLPADRAWAEGQRRLDRIETEGLEPQIKKMIGAHFVEGARIGNKALGDAVGTGENARPLPSTTALHEANMKFGRAVAAYCRALAHDVDEDDEASVARFTSAVAPIDHHRAQMARGGGGSDDEEPQTPTPVVTPTPVTPAPEPVV